MRKTVQKKLTKAEQKLAAKHEQDRHVGNLARAIGDALKVSKARDPLTDPDIQNWATIAYWETHATVFAVLPGGQNNANAKAELRKGITARCRKIRALWPGMMKV